MVLFRQFLLIAPLATALVGCDLWLYGWNADHVCAMLLGVGLAWYHTRLRDAR